jgi:DNA mismatch endonuclease (patch repair protein)
MDTLSPEQRSERMARVKGRDTKPELTVRRTVHGMGFRFRLHRRDLPGKPDLVFPGRRKVIFVHGCFWHRHEGCRLARMPKSRVDFWSEKLCANVDRDQRNLKALAASGWETMIVWECELADVDSLRERLAAFLNERGDGHSASR